MLLHQIEHIKGPVSVKVYHESIGSRLDNVRMEVYDSNKKLVAFSNSKFDGGTRIKIINEDNTIYELRSGGRYHTKDKISEN